MPTKQRKEFRGSKAQSTVPISSPSSVGREQAISLPPFLYCREGHKVPYREDVKRWICELCGSLEICSPEQAPDCEFHNMPGIKKPIAKNCWCGRELVREALISGKVAQIELIRLSCPSLKHTYFTTEKKAIAAARAQR